MVPLDYLPRRRWDRTRSLPANSRKREYRNCRPETFGNLAAPGVDFATQRLSQMYESPPNAGLSRLIGRSRRMSGLVGWGGRDRTSEWRNQNPLPYRLA